MKFGVISCFKMKSVLLFLVLVKYASSSFCYWNSGCPYKYFSDKTPYNNVRGDIRDSIVKLKGCQPISIWFIIGTPKSISEINHLKSLNESLTIRQQVISNYKDGKSSLCAQDVENLQKWIADNKLLSKTNFLTEEGVQELTGISNRLQEAFPSLLRDLKDGNYKLSSSSGLAEESAKAFLKGFRERLSINTHVDGIIPYEKCKKYQDLLENPDFYNEVRKYEKTSDFFATKDRIQRRLGIQGLSDGDIKSLYDLCRFAWSGIENKFSPWCALFTTEDLHVLEYVGDLEHYYRSGYGTPINGVLGRFPLADLLTNFQEAKDGIGVSIVAHFSDSTTLDMVGTALNLFEDESPLSGASRNPKRKWRTSKLSVFSANLVAVLNRCQNDGDTDHNVVFYLNEEPLLPICQRGFCSWEEFEEKLRPFKNVTVDNNKLDPSSKAGEIYSFQSSLPSLMSDKSKGHSSGGSLQSITRSPDSITSSYCPWFAPSR